MKWDRTHPRTALTIRTLLALWITALVVMLCAIGRWWGLFLVIPLGFDLYLIRQIVTDGRIGRQRRLSP